MAEVTGIPSLDPSDYSSIDSSSDSSAVLGALTGKFDILNEKLQTWHKERQDVLISIKTAITDGPLVKSIASNVSALVANTAALQELSTKIDTASVEHTITGSGTFFAKFIDAANNDKTSAAVSKFGRLFSNVTEQIANMAKHADKIDELSKSLIGFFGSAKAIGKSLALAGAGIAIFGLSIITFMDAITIEDLAMFLGLMGALSLAARMMRNVKVEFGLGAAGIALMGLAIWGFTELIDFDMATTFATSLGMIGASVWAYNKLAGNVNSKNIAKSAAAIAAVAGSVWLFNKAASDLDPVNLTHVGNTLLAAGGAALLMFTVGKLNSGMAIERGALASAFVGGGLWALSEGLQSFSEVQFDPDRMLQTSVAAVAAIGILGLIGAAGPVAVAIMLGAASAATVGGALWALAGGLNAIGTVQITSQQADNFSQSLSLTVSALADAFGIKTGVMLGMAVPQALLMTGATLASVGAIWAVSKMPTVDTSKFDAFATGIKSLTEAYTSIGWKDSLKATAGSALMTLVSSATVLTAGAIRLITWAMPSEPDVTKAIDSFKAFTVGLLGAYDIEPKKIDNVRRGLEAFVGVSNVAKDIADTVNEIGNLYFVEKEVRDGKLVAVGARKMTDQDFANVGISMGKLLSALTDPLTKIGEQQDTFSIGGFKITNPFSNKVQDGIKAFSGIGEVLNPITSAVKLFADNNNPQFVQDFTVGFGSILSGISTAFTSNADDIASLDVASYTRAKELVNSMVWQVSQEKFVKAVPNWGKFTMDVVKIKDSLNAMDLQKLASFNSIVWNLNEMAKNGAMRELVEVFEQFIEKFTQYIDSTKQQTASYTESNTTVNNTQPAVQSTTSKPQQQQQNTKPQHIDIGALVSKVNELKQLFISGVATVKVKNDNFTL